MTSDAIAIVPADDPREAYIAQLERDLEHCRETCARYRKAASQLAGLELRINKATPRVSGQADEADVEMRLVALIIELQILRKRVAQTGDTEWNFTLSQY